MKNTNVLKAESSSRITRALTAAVIGVASLLIFGLGVTASAATLTRELELGSTGQDVSDLQIFLAKDSTIYPQGLVTGYFGSLTKSAVSNFQAKNGIATVGRVGPVTLAAINSQMSGDNSSPIINSLNVNVTNNSATLGWNTNENAAAVVYYGTSPLSMIEGSPTGGVTIGGSSFLVNTFLQSTFSAPLTALSANTTYYYVVYAKDESGNETVTWPSTFRTNQ